MADACASPQTLESREPVKAVATTGDSPMELDTVQEPGLQPVPTSVYEHSNRVANEAIAVSPPISDVDMAPTRVRSSPLTAPGLLVSYALPMVTARDQPSLLNDASDISSAQLPSPSDSIANVGRNGSGLDARGDASSHANVIAEVELFPIAADTIFVGCGGSAYPVNETAIHCGP